MHIGIINDPESTNQTLKRFWAIESSGTLPAVKSFDHFKDTCLKTINVRKWLLFGKIPLERRSCFVIIKAMKYANEEPDHLSTAWLVFQN